MVRLKFSVPRCNSFSPAGRDLALSHVGRQLQGSSTRRPDRHPVLQKSRLQVLRVRSPVLLLQRYDRRIKSFKLDRNYKYMAYKVCEAYIVTQTSTKLIAYTYLVILRHRGRNWPVYYRDFVVILTLIDPAFLCRI